MIGSVLKWTFWAVVWGLLVAFLHYTLPRWDVVRIVDTYERRVDFGSNSFFWAGPDAGNALTPNRDVFFIQTIQSDGDPMIYRNEDTAWGWPPYFKFNTANLQARAADLVSISDQPRWVAIKHYGWRSELLSIHPNAIAVQPVAGPEVRIVPWTAILVLAILVLVLWFVLARWLRFKHRRLDPWFDDLDLAWADRRARWAERRAQRRERRP